MQATMAEPNAKPFSIIFKQSDTAISMFRIYTIQDAETGSWTAFSNEIPGLVVEADTYDGLMQEIRYAAEELIILNNVPHTDKVELLLKNLSMDEARNVGLL